MLKVYFMTILSRLTKVLSVFAFIFATSPSHSLAFDCSSPAPGVRCEGGFSWDRYFSSALAFSQFHTPGWGEERDGGWFSENDEQITKDYRRRHIAHCFVFGPKANLQTAGTIVASFEMGFWFADQGSFAPPNTHPNELFVIDISADSGREILARRWVTRSEFEPVPGNPGKFKLKSNKPTIQATISEPKDGVEARVCHPMIGKTTIHVFSTELLHVY
jgi:hypothetical protein